MTVEKDLPGSLNTNLINGSNSVKKDSIPKQIAPIQKLPDGFDMTFIISEL